MKCFVRLVDGTGAVKWQADWHPGELAGKPWSAAPWQSGEAVRDDLYVPIATDVPYGRYRLQAGMYTQAKDDAIIPLAPECSGDAGAEPDGTITIADLMVVERWSGR